MAEYLKGDTFIGKPEDVQKKVTQALIQSGGIKKGDPYTSVEEFTNKTKASISAPLELYSGLGWNTWQNQVGNLAYQTPEYNLDAVFISTYHSIQIKIIEAFIKKKIHIFCEKPGGTSYKETYRLLN